MVRRKYPELADEAKKLKKLCAGLKEDKGISQSQTHGENYDGMEELPVRLQKLMELFKTRKPKPTEMLHFVMYDIESNKVRKQVAKYLLAMGCFRVQKSIFLADLSADKAAKIKTDLAEVQACYENEDSIMILPVPTDNLQSMKIIGRNINVDLITKSVSTLFF